jgi:hypothetical protein
MLRAGFKPLDALSVVQLVSQLVVGHAMWSLAADGMTLEIEAPPHVQQIERALVDWDADRELALGIDALIHGFERLLD